MISLIAPLGAAATSCGIGTLRLGDKCVGCQPGMVCGTISDLKTVVLEHGYWRESNTSLLPTHCFPSYHCGGGLAVGDASCRFGFSGEACKICHGGRSFFGLECRPCSNESTTYRGVLVALAVLLLLSPCCHIWCNRPRATSKVVLNLVLRQISGVVGAVPADNLQPDRLGKVICQALDSRARSLDGVSCVTQGGCVTRVESARRFEGREFKVLDARKDTSSLADRCGPLEQTITVAIKAETAVMTETAAASLESRLRRQLCRGDQDKVAKNFEADFLPKLIELDTDDGKAALAAAGFTREEIQGFWVEQIGFKTVADIRSAAEESDEPKAPRLSRRLKSVGGRLIEAPDGHVLSSHLSLDPPRKPWLSTASRHRLAQLGGLRRTVTRRLRASARAISLLAKARVVVSYYQMMVLTSLSLHVPLPWQVEAEHTHCMRMALTSR